ncbi:hypothetical protein [Mesoplasma melaleucae]|uniref:Uncharacterized protein n=1 Tax=Mesoplasma melaleucae TaxID=81459 RepID=A0A2K8NVM9_9MOLU|nr:hypothetical protein [Mesoplasma melaleucae]ATZ17804.1 hypothetical protein EMELA_v1c02310 [Mesoplasma melaleucae]
MSILKLKIEVDPVSTEINSELFGNLNNYNDKISLLSDKEKLKMSQQIRTATNQLTNPLKITSIKTSKPKANVERINWKAEYFKLKKEFDEFKEFAMNAINELKADNAQLRAEVAELKYENAQLRDQVKYFQDKYEPEMEM